MTTADMQACVDDNEQVCRLISSPLGYNEATGVSPDSFRLFRKNESYISVERLLLLPLQSIIAEGDNIKKWFHEGETFWGAAILSVSRIRENAFLDVQPKGTPTHPSHAGIEMRLSDGTVYKADIGEPTPHEVLLLQLYLSTIVERIVPKQ
jgi:hypothetical protein